MCVCVFGVDTFILKKHTEEQKDLFKSQSMKIISFWNKKNFKNLSVSVPLSIPFYKPLDKDEDNMASVLKYTL